MGILGGKAIIVTGAGGGIGRAACSVLAAAGARLVVSDVAQEAGEETTRIVTSEGGEAVFVAADLASEEAIARLVAKTVEVYGRLDGAFNNAGVEQRNKPLADLTLAEWQRAIDIDLTAVFLCIKHQVKAMLETGGGSIVNTASSLGQVGLAGASEYCAAKHGVIGLTRALGIEYAAQGIRVNAIAPGYIETQLVLDHWNEQADPAAARAATYALQPPKRIGKPEEVAMTAVFLASDEAPFINASCITVDGGRSALYHD
jgi:NAD(P)-dependent dehydrogenase (short-subunit alcohol dehydrogenase family)